MGLFDTKVQRLFSSLWQFEIAIGHVVGKGGTRRFTRGQLWTDLNAPGPFSEATFKRYMSRCVSEGVFEIAGYGKSTGGRPPAYYRVNLRVYNRQLEARQTEANYRKRVATEARIGAVRPLLVPRWGWAVGNLFTISLDKRLDVDSRARRMERTLADAWPWLASELRTGEMIVIGPWWKPKRARAKV